jgi:hypothetical protein
VVAHAFSPSTWEAEAGVSSRAARATEKPCLKKPKKKKKKKKKKKSYRTFLSLLPTVTSREKNHWEETVFGTIYKSYRLLEMQLLLAVNYVSKSHSCVLSHL